MTSKSVETDQLYLVTKCISREWWGNCTVKDRKTLLLQRIPPFVSLVLYCTFTLQKNCWFTHALIWAESGHNIDTLAKSMLKAE